MDAVSPDRKSTRSTTHRARDRSVRQIFPIVVAAGLGLALLGLGIPRTVAAWAAVEAQPALLKVGTTQEPSDAELTAAVAGLQRAVAWVPSARSLTNLGALEIVQARRRSFTDPRRAELLVAAEQHLSDGLQANPADGFAWFNLAVVGELRGAPGRKVATALVQSLDMAPNIRQLWILRAGKLLAYRPYLKDDEVFALRSHLRTIWSAHEVFRLPLMQAAQRSGQLSMIPLALNGDPEAQAEFARLKTKLPQ